MKKVYVFDLDGTLLDSTAVWHTIDEEFLGKRGLLLERDYAEAVSVMHLQEAAVYTIDRFSLNETPDAVAAEWEQMAYDFYASRVQVKDGARDYLLQLREHGARVVLATALSRKLAEAALARLGLAELFETVIYADEIGYGKNSAAFYLAVAAFLGVTPAECVMYEDTLRGVRSAKEAGMFTVAIEDEGSRDCREEIRCLADEYWTEYKI